MATIFISYQSNDKPLALGLQKALEAQRHKVRLDANGLLAGHDWRRFLLDSLGSSDAVAVLLSANSLNSHFVMAEIGAARVFADSRGLVLLPVLVGKIGVPLIVGDIQAIGLKGGDSRSLSSTAAEIDRAVTGHFAEMRGRYPQIFISHRHKDVDIATALARMLEATFYVEREDIRCTSVHPYKLRMGERTPDRLRAEIRHAKAVLGILTPDTHESSYVMFELGAAWGQKVPSIPLLAKGAQLADIPSPISDLHPIQLADSSDCYQFINDLPEIVDLRSRRGAAQKTAEKVAELVARAQPGPTQQPAAAGASNNGAAGAPGRADDEGLKGVLRKLLSDPKYPDGRSLDTLCRKAGPSRSKNECRRLLVEIGAREVELQDGEGWTLRPRL
ncbi:MAG: toll/interleukin-1 receptor domain-containing protein [Pyrinomonadaceae bacterium]